MQPGGAARRPLRVTPQSDQQNVGLAAGSRGLRRPASRPPATPSLQPGSCALSSRRPPHAARGTPGLGILGQATRALRKWRHSARVAWRRFRKQSRGWLEGKCMVAALGSVFFVCSRGCWGGRGIPTTGCAASAGADAPLLGASRVREVREPLQARPSVRAAGRRLCVVGRNLNRAAPGRLSASSGPRTPPPHRWVRRGAHLLEFQPSAG